MARGGAWAVQSNPAPAPGCAAARNDLNLSHSNAMGSIRRRPALRVAALELKLAPWVLQVGGGGGHRARSSHHFRRGRAGPPPAAVADDQTPAHGAVRRPAAAIRRVGGT